MPPLIVFTHPDCLAHDPGPGHPESPARLQVVLEALRGHFHDLDWRQAPAATRESLLRVHTASLLHTVLDAPLQGLRHLDPDTVMGPASPQAVLHAAGAAVAAVDAVIEAGTGAAFCAVRPPGHHATADSAMGFCLLNHVAIAAAHARDLHGLDRIAIVDFDVHHGNGTQAIFAGDRRVAYFSSHQSGLYPHSGTPGERGVGNLHNALLPPGSGGMRFRDIWLERLLPALDQARPQLLIVSAGFDAHRSDPLADLMLEADDYAWITRELAALAARHAQGRVVSVLEGGYAAEGLREGVVAHVGALRQACAGTGGR